MTKKADKKRCEALICFILVISSTLVTPLFIALGQGLLFGKVVPSVLSLLAAASTTWLQVRRPQQLWGLYRTAQRELEDQQTRHAYRIGDYSTASNPDTLLAEKVADVAIELHRQWVPMIPNPESLKGSGAEAKALATGGNLIVK